MANEFSDSTLIPVVLTLGQVKLIRNMCDYISKGNMFPPYQELIDVMVNAEYESMLHYKKHEDFSVCWETCQCEMCR